MREVRSGAEEVPDENGVPTTDHFVSLGREHHLRDGPRVAYEHLHVISSEDRAAWIHCTYTQNCGSMFDSRKTRGLAKVILLK